ncbi:dnaJ homolog subfamily C member 30, mitochondrial-like [Genypterus blacodes]|uniref:dnaJ homolog subfamily C member 30, mitochondrial-like n=1 Tax=Genypterus blacodes TaxID=154954 RepID=UPI003F76DB21
MAGVKLQLGKGVHNFVNKSCNRDFMGTFCVRNRTSTCNSSLPTGFLLAGVKNDEVSGTRATHRQQDSYTTKLLLGTAENGVGACVDTSQRRTQKYLTTRTSRSLWRQQSLFRGHEQFVCVRAYSGTGERSEPLYRTKTGYYAILQVTTTATQAQIKTAYYKQSFLFHPDRNAGSQEATVRFSEVSEAYSVLGNKTLRRKYDRGLLSPADLNGATRRSAEGPGASARPTATDRSVAGMNSQDIFDFDKFYQSHYNEQLQRERNNRVRKEEMQQKKQERTNMADVCLALLVLSALAIMFSMKRG